MASFKPFLGLGRTVALRGIAETLLRSVRPDLDDASSSGDTTAPTSEQ